ncbi:uncharacterized protein G2W53_018258 [Senna tora]|uniref:Uncharacterized protein n=1 Tax=Senna tora TaxID=362788 RepID=A0A834TSN7_9FABA|nr:uncharacterized protein G2W53_018258 [Senna tora]
MSSETTTVVTPELKHKFVQYLEVQSRRWELARYVRELGQKAERVASLETSRSFSSDFGGSDQSFDHNKEVILKGMKVANLSAFTFWFKLIQRSESSVEGCQAEITTVKDYQARFAELSTKLQDIPEACLISFFIASLEI